LFSMWLTFSSTGLKPKGYRMPLTKLTHWQALLNTYILECSGAPFAYGVLDCGLFAAGAIGRMTGVEVAQPFLEAAYSDAESARGAIQKVTGTGNTIEDAVRWIAAEHGLKEVTPNILFAQRGDLVLFHTSAESGGLAAGIVSLEGRYALFMGEAGLHKVPVKTCKTAWRVG